MDSIITLDIEASGFGRGSYPIEVGVVMANGDSFCSLIKPEPEWQHWDQKAQRLHGIDRDVLKDHGKSVRTVAQLLNSQLAEQIVYSDAWGHDSSWLATLYDAAELSQHFKLESICTLLSEAQRDIWHDVKAQLQTMLSGRRHRASNDAKLIQQTWLKTLEISHKPSA